MSIINNWGLLMDEKELSFILQEGEGLKVEFKEGFDAKGLAKEMVAFANAQGGQIFLGVCDNGTIQKIDLTNRLKSMIQDVARNCDPSIKIEIESQQGVVIITVFEGKDKPYKCSEGFYLREGASSQKLSRNEIVAFIADVGKIRFDEQIKDDFVFPRDFDERKFTSFLRQSGLTKVGSIKDMLLNLSAAKKIGTNIKFKNAGVLFFGKELSVFSRQNGITCVLYKGKERLHIIDRKDFTEDLLSNYESALRFLKTNLRIEYIIKGAGARIEMLELPEEAIREALLNALVHRDYFETGFGLFVEIFDDRVEITNKGKLLFDKRKLGKMSVARNPLIFDLCYRLHLIEKVGSGINRIKQFVRERGLVVQFEVDDFFKVIFLRKKSVAESEPLNGPLNGPLKQLVDYIGGTQGVNRLQLMEVFGFPRTTMARYLLYLLKEGFIEYVGSKKKGYYVVKREKV